MFDRMEEVLKKEKKKKEKKFLLSCKLLETWKVGKILLKP